MPQVRMVAVQQPLPIAGQRWERDFNDPFERWVLWDGNRQVGSWCAVEKVWRYYHGNGQWGPKVPWDGGR